MRLRSPLAFAFGLRVWGVHHGLPYAYNADENAHFVTRAIGLFGHSWDPQYDAHPPAYTYLAHLLLGAWYGGREGVSEVFATDPTQIWVLAPRAGRRSSARSRVRPTYLARARLVDRRVGLLSAGIFAVAFLPVFDSKLALNDAPTLAGCASGCGASAGVLRHGGCGLRLGGHRPRPGVCDEYTGGIVLAPLVAATIVQFTAPGGSRGRVRAASRSRASWRSPRS